MSAARFPFTKYGLACDPRHAHVTLAWRGRMLLGEVVGAYRDDTTSVTRLRVRHFNGEPWPLDPAAAVVGVLDREAS
jgi:hypothetical protein